MLFLDTRTKATLLSQDPQNVLPHFTNRMMFSVKTCTG